MRQTKQQTKEVDKLQQNNNKKNDNSDIQTVP